ncbi:MAG: DUF1501 domain-containing protein [Planctomycetales bacterium]|nr:DUF1501 domain-containing protein [Planctomycetales bacterium]
MLAIQGQPLQLCNGLTRRDVLRAGGAGLLGTSLPILLAAEEAGAVVAPRAKSVMFLFLFGGPSQLETFDMKPEAPKEIRGPYQPIASRSPGLLVSDHLPKVAAMSDKFAVIRTMTHQQNDHNACHIIQTGHEMPPAERGPARVNATEKDWPAFGSVVEYLDQRADAQRPAEQRRDFPSFVYLPNRLGHIQGYDRSGQYGGWLGQSYNPLATRVGKRDAKDDPYFRDCTEEELTFRIEGVEAHADVTLDRLNRRESLLTQFDTARRDLDQSRGVRDFGRSRERAFDLVSSEKMRAAFDIRRESPQLRDRYGRHLFGQSTLMGRRMIEAGARFVTVLWDAPGGYSWDSHRDSTEVDKYLLPGFDQSFSALLEDMTDRGLLDETLIVCLGEMGRTPRGNANWGRDHWGYCFPAVLAGAGIRGGAVYGRSDKDAAYPQDKPVSPVNLGATIFHALGISPDTRVQDALGRPVPVMEGGQPLTELFG